MNDVFLRCVYFMLVHWLELISCHNGDSWTVFSPLWIISWSLNFPSLIEILVTVVTVEWFFLSVDSFMISQLNSFVEIIVTVVTVEWFMIVQLTDMSKVSVTAVTVFIIKLMECCPKWNILIEIFFIEYPTTCVWVSSQFPFTVA